MSAALQIFYSGFDTAFFKLPPPLQARIEAKLDDLGLRLKTFPHHRLTGHNRFRLRVGDYRIIYTFDAERNVLHLLAVGNRREIYRNY
jgi:mRNA interferase RelE/StbE